MNKLMKRFYNLNKRTLYLIGFIDCLLLISYALYSEYVLGLEPCPLCVFQRIAVILVGFIFLVLAVFVPKTSVTKFISSMLITITSLSGVIIAGRHVWLQNLPPDKVPGCGPGLDFMVSTFPLSEVFEMVFTGSGECANVDWSFLSLSMPAWVMILLALIGYYGVWIAYKRDVT